MKQKRKGITLYRKWWSKPSQEKEIQKGKIVVWRGLTNSWEKENAKAKEKRKDIHLNAEFQRTARRHKKAFVSDQCKEIEENSRMGKTRDLFKKIWNTKGTFHAKMGTIKHKMARTSICWDFPKSSLWWEEILRPQKAKKRGRKAPLRLPPWVMPWGPSEDASTSARASFGLSFY